MYRNESPREVERAISAGAVVVSDCACVRVNRKTRAGKLISIVGGPRIIYHDSLREARGRVRIDIKLATVVCVRLRRDRRADLSLKATRVRACENKFPEYGARCSRVNNEKTKKKRKPAESVSLPRVISVTRRDKDLRSASFLVHSLKHITCHIGLLDTARGSKMPIYDVYGFCDGALLLLPNTGDYFPIDKFRKCLLEMHSVFSR